MQNIDSRSFNLKKITNNERVQTFYGLTYLPSIIKIKYEYYTSCKSTTSFAKVKESTQIPLSMFAPVMAIEGLSFSKFLSDVKKILIPSGLNFTNRVFEKLFNMN